MPEVEVVEVVRGTRGVHEIVEHPRTIEAGILLVLTHSSLLRPTRGSASVRVCAIGYSTSPKRMGFLRSNCQRGMGCGCGCGYI